MYLNHLIICFAGRSRQLQGLQDMEVENAVEESYVPEAPLDAKVAPVSFQKMEVDINSVKAEMEALEATIKNAKLEMEEDLFVPGTAGDIPAVNVGTDNLDLQSVKAKLRAKLQRKSEETKLMQNMERTLAEDVNTTAKRMDQDEMSNYDSQSSQQGDAQHVIRMQQDTGQSHSKTKELKQGNDVQYDYEAVPHSVPKHTTDSNQDL